MPDLNTFFFFLNIHQKWKYYREEKQDFERYLIFLNIKMSAKSKKIERESNKPYVERTIDPLDRHVGVL